MSTSTHPELDGLGRYEYGWRDPDAAGSIAKRGLSEEVVREISALKSEPEWMLDLRLKGLRLFEKKPMPTWGSNLGGIDFDTIKYFVRSTEKQATSWDELPDDIRTTYDRLGIPEAEKQRLIAGVAAQYESEVVYHKIREDLEEQGVIFLDTDTALREHEELFREYFASVIPVGDNKFAALNTAVWSGGSFIYVPPGVNVEIPLQAYFRINTENMGQFERTKYLMLSKSIPLRLEPQAGMGFFSKSLRPFSRRSSIHCGSPFFALMSRTTSSLSPRRASAPA